MFSGMRNPFVLRVLELEIRKKQQQRNVKRKLFFVERKSAGSRIEDKAIKGKDNKSSDLI